MDAGSVRHGNGRAVRAHLLEPAPPCAGTGKSERRQTGNAAFGDALCVCEQTVPASAAETRPVHTDVPAMQDLPINSDDADWQQAPDGTVPHDTSRDTLPGTEAHDAAPAAQAAKIHH